MESGSQKPACPQPATSHHITTRRPATSVRRDITQPQLSDVVGYRGKSMRTRVEKVLTN